MKILFVCKANSGRSQMAEVFLNKMSRKYHATSAGIHVTKKGQLHGHVIKCMKEIGYDLSRKRRTQLTPEIAEKPNKIIVIMEPHEVENFLPLYVKNSNKTEYWPIKNATGTDYEFHCMVRNQIKRRVKFLLSELNK